MESLRQVGSGLLFGLVCLAIVLGGFALSMVEGGMGAVALPSSTSTQAAPATRVPAISPTLPLETPTQPLNPITDTPAPTATETFTPPPPPTNCPPPAGWVATVVQVYDTLPGLAQTYRTSVDAIRQANCLVSDQLVPGSFLYLPPLPTATLIPCGAPPGWVNYVVQSGDTLFSLSQKFRVSVSELQRANCLGSSTFIQAGKVIKVPNVPTSTPLNSATPSATLIVIKEETPTPTLTLPAPTTEAPPATEVPSQTPVPPSDTPPAPSNTPSPTATIPPTATP
jgi:LysM repeat protein